MDDLYRQIFLNLTDPVLIQDAHGKLLDANAAAAALLGTSREQLAGAELTQFMTPEAGQRFAAELVTLRNTERHQFRSQLLGPGQHRIEVAMSATALPERNAPFTTTAGDVVIVVRVDSDETRSGSAASGARATAASASAEATLSFFIARDAGTVRHPPLRKGDPPGPLDWSERLLSHDLVKEAIKQAWAGDETRLSLGWHGPAPDSPLLERRWLNVICNPLRQGASVTQVCVRLTDATAEQLDEFARTETLQRLFGGLLLSSFCHEFNNHLGIILAQASGLRLTLPQGQLPPPALGAVVDATQQAAALLRRWSDTAAALDASREDLDISSLLDDCAPLLAHAGAGHAELILDTSVDCPLVRGHREMLRLLVLGLARAAFRTVRSGGTVVLKTFRLPPALPHLPSSLGLSLSTTHPQGVTGIGAESHSLELAIARAILRVHAGALEVLSTSAQGTLWEIVLPGSQNTLDQAVRSAAHNRDKKSSGIRAPAGAVPVGEAAARNHRKVLLADDEENFRMFTSWALRERGYEVITAEDGHEAFERFREAPESFALVILDAYMPRMGGLEAYLRMQVLRADLPVLFASGFARGASVDALIAGCPGPATVLLKPFSTEDLLKAVERALGASVAT